MKQTQVKTEKQVLELLDHPNIIKLYFTFQDSENLYFVLEYSPNGDLYELLQKTSKLIINNRHTSL